MRSTTDIAGIYPPSGGFAHSSTVENPTRWLITSGTMGLNESWEAPDSIEEQLAAIWQNLKTILAADKFSVDNIAHITCLLTDPAHCSLNGKAIATALNGRRVPRTVFCTQLLDTSWLAEIQVIAVQTE